jgi:hypothetical protein
MSTPPPPGSRPRALARLQGRLRELASAPGLVFRRFPLPALAAGASMVLLLRAISRDEGMDLFPPVALGIPLFLALRLAGERGIFSRVAAPFAREPGRAGPWIEGALTLAVAGGLAAFLVLWTGWPEPIRVLRYGLLFVAAHLLVAVLPFVRTGEGFRPFNRHLLLRVVEGGLQALVLLAGISMALLAVDNLFGVRIPSETYLRLGAILLTAYLPLHVLSGITFSPPAEDPRPLRIVARWILVPLASLYLGILTAYLVQVLALRMWPSGWIGWLVAWMAVVGTLSVLLVRPSAPEEDRWAWRWERLFWILMVPAAGMFLTALARRIGQYGVTEPRYLGVVLGGWLLVMAALYGLTRVRDLRLLPATLALLLLGVMVGPWGMTGASERSQVGRLAALVAAPDPRNEGEIRAVLNYLYQTHPRVELGQVLGPAWTASVTLPSGETLRPSEPPAVRGARYARTEATLLALGMVSPMYGGGEGRIPTGQLQLVRAGAGTLAGEGVPVAGYHRVFQVSISPPGPTGHEDGAAAGAPGGGAAGEPGSRPPVPPASRTFRLRVGSEVLSVALISREREGPGVELVVAPPGVGGSGGAPGAAAGGEPAGGETGGSQRYRVGDVLARFDLSAFLTHPALPDDFSRERGEEGWDPERRGRQTTLEGLPNAPFLLEGEPSAGVTLPPGFRLALVVDRVTVVREEAMDTARRGEAPVTLHPRIHGMAWLLVGEGEG